MEVNFFYYLLYDITLLKHYDQDEDNFISITLRLDLMLVLGLLLGRSDGLGLLGCWRRRRLGG